MHRANLVVTIDRLDRDDWPGKNVPRAIWGMAMFH